MSSAFAEAWLLGFLLIASLTIGAVLVLAIGHLLGEAWLHPLRPPLEAAARWAPVLLPLWLPVLLAGDLLYPHGGGLQAGFAIRGGGFLLLLAGFGRLLARPGEHPTLAGAALVFVVPLAGLVAAQDWVFARDPAWFGSLFGIVAVIEAAGAALALATLLVLARDAAGPPAQMPPAGERDGLERVLLAFAMATLWLWFVQFVVVWAADMPDEAAWYLRRDIGGWRMLRLAVWQPALLAVILLAIVPRWSRWRLVAVCGALLLSYPAHLLWVVRPDSPGAVPPFWVDAAVLVCTLAVLAMLWSGRRAGKVPRPEAAARGEMS